MAYNPITGIIALGESEGILNDIRSALNTTESRLSRLCTHSAIKPMSKRKPFRTNVMAIVDDGARLDAMRQLHMGMDFANAHCDAALASKPWAYLRPQGLSAGSPYRQLDFRGYCSRATSPVISLMRSFVIGSTASFRIGLNPTGKANYDPDYCCTIQELFNDPNYSYYYDTWHVAAIGKSSTHTVLSSSGKTLKQIIEDEGGQYEWTWTVSGVTSGEVMTFQFAVVNPSATASTVLQSGQNKSLELTAGDCREVVTFTYNPTGKDALYNETVNPFTFRATGNTVELYGDVYDEYVFSSNIGVSVSARSTFAQSPLSVRNLIISAQRGVIGFQGGYVTEVNLSSAGIWPLLPIAVQAGQTVSQNLITQSSIVNQVKCYAPQDDYAFVSIKAEYSTSEGEIGEFNNSMTIIGQ